MSYSKQNAFMVSLHLSIALLLLCNLACRCQTDTPNCDQALLPMPPSTLKMALLDSKNDSVRMYDLIRRGDKQKQSDLVYDILNALRKKEPNNAVVQAAYCFAYRVAEGDYDGPGFRGKAFTNLDDQHYLNALTKAYKLNPKLWLTYAVEGHSLITSPYSDRKALYLLKTAVKLAPDISYTHTLLGDAYAVYYTPFQSFQKAEAQYITAQHLQPISSHNADALFDLYDVRIRNTAKARKAKEYLLSTVPTNYKFPPDFSARLAKY